MRYVIGADEAGYGPNLGPLVISATVWQVPDDIGPGDLYDCLEGVVAASATQGRERRSRALVAAAAEDAGRRGAPSRPHPRPLSRKRERGACGEQIVMADSKALYSPGKGVGRLEAGVLTALGLLGHRPETWRGVWQALAPAALDPIESIPWLANFDAPIPRACPAEEIEAGIAFLRAGMSRAGVRLLGIRSRAVFEGEFNDLTDRHGSKGAALSHETLALVAGAIESLAPRQEAVAISVVCDKHGGRNCYGALLDEHFPDHFIEIHGEGPRQSLYRFGPPERRHEVTFRVNGESCLPAALASMASKYLRELAMHALNDYWRRRVPGLRPTAGYPGDARRFREDIAEAFRGMDISERALWRQR